MESIENNTEKKMPVGEELKAITTHWMEKQSRPTLIEFISPIVGTIYLHRNIRVIQLFTYSPHKNIESLRFVIHRTETVPYEHTL